MCRDDLAASIDWPVDKITGVGPEMAASCANAFKGVGLCRGKISYANNQSSFDSGVYQASAFHPRLQ
jgi:hypothetical protein